MALPKFALLGRTLDRRSFCRFGYGGEPPGILGKSDCGRRDGHAGRSGCPYEINLRRGQAGGLVDEVAEGALQFQGLGGTGAGGFNTAGVFLAQSLTDSATAAERTDRVNYLTIGPECLRIDHCPVLWKVQVGKGPVMLQGKPGLAGLLTG